MAFVSCGLRYIDCSISADGDFLYGHSEMDGTAEVAVTRGMHPGLFSKEIFNPSSDGTLFDARLLNLVWTLSGVADPLLEMEFKNRWKTKVFYFRYVDPRILVEGNVLPNAQGLRMQVLGATSSCFRHEFLFENGSLVVCAKGFKYEVREHGGEAAH